MADRAFSGQVAGIGAFHRENPERVLSVLAIRLRDRRATSPKCVASGSARKYGKEDLRESSQDSRPGRAGAVVFGGCSDAEGSTRGRVGTGARHGHHAGRTDMG